MAKGGRESLACLPPREPTVVRLLFLGRDNASRSQLAEGIAPWLSREVEAWSAGSSPTHMRKHARIVLGEMGIPSYGLRSKRMAEVPLEDIDLAIVLCEPEQAPFLPPRIEVLHWPLPDPSCAPEHDALEAWRACRDELIRRLELLLPRLLGPRTS